MEPEDEHRYYVSSVQTNKGYSMKPLDTLHIKNQSIKFSLERALNYITLGWAFTHFCYFPRNLNYYCFGGVYPPVYLLPVGCCFIFHIMQLPKNLLFLVLLIIYICLCLYPSLNVVNKYRLQYEGAPKSLGESVTGMKFRTRKRWCGLCVLIVTGDLGSNAGGCRVCPGWTVYLVCLCACTQPFLGNFLVSMTSAV